MLVTGIRKEEEPKVITPRFLLWVTRWVALTEKKGTVQRSFRGESREIHGPRQQADGCLVESGILRRKAWMGVSFGAITVCMVFKLWHRKRNLGNIWTEKRVRQRPMSQDCQPFRGHVRNQSPEMRLLGVAVNVGEILQNVVSHPLPPPGPHPHPRKCQVPGEGWAVECCPEDCATPSPWETSPGSCSSYWLPSGTVMSSKQFRQQFPLYQVMHGATWVLELQWRLLTTWREDPPEWYAFCPSL